MAAYVGNGAKCDYGRRARCPTDSTAGGRRYPFDFLEGGLEFCHFFLGAYGDADVCRHDGPYAADQHVLFCHGIADFLATTFGVE
jgi:hypothetical protein